MEEAMEEEMAEEMEVKESDGEWELYIFFCFWSRESSQQLLQIETWNWTIKKRKTHSQIAP